jgi:hypothetical protein
MSERTYSPSQRIDLLDSLDAKGLIHIWGISGSGKTLFALQSAAIRSKNSHVLWVCTDMKLSFIDLLKDYVDYFKGISSNISVIVTKGSSETYTKICQLEDEIKDNTSLVVIDSITRVLDMARRDPSVWGREMIEDILPFLAGLVRSKNISILCVSECRTLTNAGPIPVFYESIKKWTKSDFHFKRQYGRFSTEIIDTITKHQIADQKVGVDGLYIVSLPPRKTVQSEDSTCLEEQSFA